MSEKKELEKKDASKMESEKVRIVELELGYQPNIKGYQPKEGIQEFSSPPQGGSGVPLLNGKKTKKKE